MKRILCFLLAVLAGGCSRHHEGVIAFQSNRDGNFEIYTMREDGSGQMRLTDNKANDISPAWSPDGSRIAFASDRDGAWDIYTMKPDGSDLRQLTKGQGSNTAPSWTPGGRRIVFISTRDAVHGDVYAMDSDGEDVQRVSSDSLVKDTPVMTEEGAHILVTLNMKGRFAIAAFSVAGKKFTILTPSESNNQTPALSPDGREILFTTDRDGSDKVYSMSVTGGDVTRRTFGTADERTPSWTSTPGIILVSKKGGIYQENLSTKKEMVLSYKGDYAPAWFSK